MVKYYLILSTNEVVPEENWMKLFRVLKELVGEDSFIKIELGEYEGEEDGERFTTDSRNTAVL